MTQDAGSILGALNVDVHEIEALTRRSVDRFALPGLRTASLTLLERRAADLRAALPSAEVAIYQARKVNHAAVARLARALKVPGEHPANAQIARALRDLAGAIERHCTAERATLPAEGSITFRDVPR